MKQLAPDDRIILCNAEPHWLYSTLYKNDSNFDNRNMGFFEGHILQNKVAIYIAGDRHYYRRHEDAKTGRQKITAGGGGAFLHPTHNEDVRQIGKRERYDLKKSFPDAETSRKLCRRNFLFPFYNPWFGIVTGILYLLTARAFLSDLGRYKLPDIFQALGAVVHDALVQPVSLYWVLAIFLGFFVFTDTYSKIYRFVAGSLHGIVHLLAVFFITWSVSSFISGGAGLDFNSNYQLFAVGILIFCGGWIAGSLIMGIYLFISLNLFSRHHNEAFSALKVADYKNFIRLKIEANGDLIIFPIGVRRVVKKWRENADLRQGPRIVPDDANADNPELIEDPIVFKKQEVPQIENTPVLVNQERQTVADDRVIFLPE